MFQLKFIKLLLVEAKKSLKCAFVKNYLDNEISFGEEVGNKFLVVDA